MSHSRALLAAAVVAAACATPSSAVVSHQTFAHANTCMPATNDLTRGTNGIRNNTTGNRSVYCGFESRDYNSDFYASLTVVLRNYASVERTVTCYWTSGWVMGGGYATASIAKPLAVDGGTPHEATITNLDKPTVGSALGLRCVLPPGTAMDTIWINAQDPAATGS